jgi:outer membrane protein OmpA-like peptidoglycan-associated protein
VTDSNQDYGYDTRSALAYGKRFLRRVDDGALRRPFMPHGIIPALILGVLAFYSMFIFSRHIQARTIEAAELALKDNNLNWVTVTADGQDVTLSGVPPSETEAKLAIDVVTRQLAGTPLWRARPAEIVRSEFVALATPAAATTPAVTPQMATRNDWTFRVSNGEIYLDGGVPDAATRQRVLDIVNQAVTAGRYRGVRDNLVVTNTAEPEGYLAVALRGASIITRCDRADTKFQARRFSVYCELPRSAETGVRTDAQSALQLGTLGDIQILTNESVSDCERALADLLTGSSIEFATGQATISAVSASRLDSIARAASACPGTLRIEGHTDNTGSAALNDSLSQRRAEAVRDALIVRGVDASRLAAQGFGSREPKADNRSASGRALNRRIEIEVVRAPG